jgi:DNA integrity scanning protein DisA with diadenylate cyclase activity
MNANKIVVPKQVANAIAHYVALADSKHEAFQDILSLGYEAEKSELILRHFEHDFDELMEALICGYEVEVTPEDELRMYYGQHKYLASHFFSSSEGAVNAIEFTLNALGIKVEGVNA